MYFVFKYFHVHAILSGFILCAFFICVYIYVCVDFSVYFFMYSCIDGLFFCVLNVFVFFALCYVCLSLCVCSPTVHSFVEN